MAANDNKELARKLFEDVWTRGDMKVAEQICDKSYVSQIPLFGRVELSNLKQVIETLKKGFPDLRFEVKDMIAEGDRVAVHWVSTGTSKGEFLGYPPNGKSASIHGLSVIDCKNGRAVRDFVEYDVITLMQTLGVQLPLGGAQAGAQPQPEIRH